MKFITKIKRRLKLLANEIIYKVLPFHYDPYIIKIIKIYYDSPKNELMVHFKYQNKGLISTRYAFDFINSKLIYLVHPKQLLVLGGDFRDYIHKRSDHQPIQTLTRVYHDP